MNNGRLLIFVHVIPNAVLATIDPSLILYGESGFRIHSAEGARYDSRSISGDLRQKNSQYRKQFSYIRGPKRMWYLKKSNLELAQGAEVLNLCDMTINMAAMHRVSEIARYKPEQLNRLMNSKENWLLHEYIAHSLDQFVDEIAAEITKQDILGAGQK